MAFSKLSFSSQWTSLNLLDTSTRSISSRPFTSRSPLSLARHLARRELSWRKLATWQFESVTGLVLSGDFIISRLLPFCAKLRQRARRGAHWLWHYWSSDGFISFQVYSCFFPKFEPKSTQNKATIGRGPVQWRQTGLSLSNRVSRRHWRRHWINGSCHCFPLWAWTRRSVDYADALV